VNVPFYGHTRQYHDIKGEIDANISRVLESGQYVMGPMLKQFEAELAAFTGKRFAIGVGNGTDAIMLTLLALGVKPGDEVITHANTFFATAEAVWMAGCKVVLVDCDEKTRCIDPARLAAAVTPRTRAVVPVHLYGQCAPMREIRKIADQHKLFVIEDNAQGIDARGDDFRIGELSDAVTTSFIIQKNLGTYGDGGAIYTDNADIDARVRKLRNHGSTRRDHHSFGFNSRLDDLHAGILSAKLKHIPEWSEQRRKWAARYDAGLAGLDWLVLPYERPGYRHVYHLYEVETRDAAQRDTLMAYLAGKGVDVKTHYSIAIHRQEGYPWGKDAEVRGPLANAEKNAASCISLPLFPELTAEEVDYVIDAVRSWSR
jgi:UDP-2-acetamido-2-deoxy-ribo-hexuluronate aminotransferase